MATVQLVAVAATKLFLERVHGFQDVGFRHLLVEKTADQHWLIDQQSEI